MSLSTEEAGCGLPSEELATTRRAVSSRASSSFSSSTTFAAIIGSFSRSLPWATFFSSASARLVAPTGATPTRSLPRRNLAIVQPWFSSPTRFSPGTRTSSKNTSLTSKPPSMSSIGRSVTPSASIGTRIIEMPACFLGASGSVRTRLKIQSACCPRVVHVFWPLITQSSPSLTPLVVSEARSEPAFGSEKPWHHQMSRLAVFGRNFFFISSEPKLAITGPIMLALKASGGGTHASCISSCQMCRWSGVQSWPPHSTGQFGTAMPASFMICWDWTIPSLPTWPPEASVSRSSWGILVVKKVRISSRNAVSSSVRASCIGAPVGL